MSNLRKPINNPPAGLRQRFRKRANDWRVWWEPNATQRALGMEAVELDAARPTWSVREAQKLNQLGPNASTPKPKVSTSSKNSIDALRIAYLKSPMFLTKSEKTKEEYIKDINRIMARWQGTDVRKLTKPIIFTWYETLFATNGPWVSRRLIRMLSIMMSYAELKGMVSINPLLRMHMMTPKGRSRTADWNEFEALDNAALQLGWHKMRLAMHLSMFMGQRETDALTARARDFVMHKVDPQSETETWQLCWKIVRSKDTTKQRLSYLAVHPDVEPILRAALEAADSPSSLLITRDTDNAAYNDTSFPYFFAKLREIATKECPSLYDLQFRDLRRTFSNNSRHANVAGDDVDDALGNTSGTDPNLRQVYMPASDIKAAEAILAVKRPAKKKTKKKA